MDNVDITLTDVTDVLFSAFEQARQELGSEDVNPIAIHERVLGKLIDKVTDLQNPALDKAIIQTRTELNDLKGKLIADNAYHEAQEELGKDAPVSDICDRTLDILAEKLELEDTESNQYDGILSAMTQIGDKQAAVLAQSDVATPQAPNPG